MSESTKNEYEQFLERIESRCEKFGKRVKKFKNWTYFIRISTFFLAGVITILAGLKLPVQSSPLWIPNLILVSGTLSTFLISLGTFWNIERYWIENVLIAHKLNLLWDRARRLGYKDTLPTQNEIEELWKSYDEILESRVGYWEGIQSNQSN